MADRSPIADPMDEDGNTRGAAFWLALLFLAVIAMAAFSCVGTERLRYEETDSGLKYQVLREGEGPEPGPTDTVIAHYEGRFQDGTIFDSSYARGQPAVFNLSQVIPGWSEGVQLMREGAKYRFVIPPHLGYGANGTGPIPPNTTLNFDVELLAVAPPGMAEAIGPDEAPAEPAAAGELTE